MARVEWTKEKLANLVKLGEAGKFAEAAKLFKCTENAVKIKYGRIKLIPAGDAHTAKNKPLFRAISIQKPGEKNPFEITQEEFTGSKTTPDVVLLLVKQMLSIKPNKTDCIIIPLSVADTKRRASNIFQQAKNYLARTNKAEMVFTIKSTFSVDNEKKYLGGRIWRFK
jgi:hypothetical protein